MKVKIGSSEVIHFVGIGGIGTSGLAQIMYNMGFKIQGSDLVQNKNTERLKKFGIRIFIGHKKQNINDATMLVISSAIKKNNEEYLLASKKKIPIFKRGDMLANIVSLKKNIVVAGSHGKTTTTSLISNILSAAKLDPTIINGGIINFLKNSAKLGKSDWSVLESDESDGSFLKISPTYSVVTNIDREHLDFYKKINNLQKSFQTFVEKTPSFGKSIICKDDLYNKKLIKKLKTNNYLTYGFDKRSNFHIHKVIKKIGYSKFEVKLNLVGKRQTNLKNFEIPLLGDHNIRNATAAIAVGLSIGIKIDIIKKALKNFIGVQRRFNKIFSIGKIDFYDDYAHHPTEIKFLLAGIKSVYLSRKIISVFQPHRFSRVRLLKKEFASGFKLCDEVVLCPVYPAGEKVEKHFDYHLFGKLIAKKSGVRVFILNSEKDLLKYFKKNLFDDELVVCMVAGSISTWIRDISTKL